MKDPVETNNDNKSARTDLHVHTVYSDGADLPETILDLAHLLGIRDLAFTDHDTTFWPDGRGSSVYPYAKDRGISLVRGVEMSAREAKTGKKAHILGYWPGCEPFSLPHLTPFCRMIRDRRNESAEKQIRVLNHLGFPIDFDEVQKNCQADMVFKHHILKTMRSRGLIPDAMGNFYREHFMRGGDCFFEIEYADALLVTEAIRKDGGFAVLAHPGQQKNLAIVPDLIEAGLSGIEYAHPCHDETVKKEIDRIANETGLLKTGGSDYHGEYTPGRILGTCTLSKTERANLCRAGFLKGTDIDGDA